MKAVHVSTIFVLVCGVALSDPAIFKEYFIDFSVCRSYSCDVNCKRQCENDEVNVNLTDLHNMLMYMSEELRETKQELEETKQRQLDSEKELTATREILNIDVAFNAQIDGNVNFADGVKIIFTKVVTNIGNGYNSTTGIFTAPYNGRYLFTVVSHVTSGYHWVWITVNGERLSVTHGHGNYDTGTTTLNRKLVVGDKVWVENIASRTYHAEYNVFSGNIIHPDF